MREMTYVSQIQNSISEAVASEGLRVLHLEDSENDAELIKAILVKNWPSCSVTLVTDLENYRTALDRGDFDLILSDCSMPTISGMEALSLARQIAPTKRFIFVSGHMGEDNAVEALKIGATDYVLKDRLARLPQAVRRAWNEMQREKMQEKAQLDLQESENRFRTIVEQSLVGVYMIQGDRFTYVNNALSQIAGYSENELITRPLLDFVAPEDRSKVSENVKKRLAGVQKAIRYQLKMLRKDGTIAFVEVYGTGVEIEGRPGIMGMLMDVTERTVAESMIREQAAYLDNAHDAIYVRDLEQNIIYWNQGAERLYGWSKEEVIGKRASNLLYRNEYPELEKVRKTVLEKGEWTGELRQVSKEGKNLVIQARRTLLRNSSGEPASILNINTDITEQKKLESQFLRVQRIESIGTLAGGIAHDLNNVLSPILMAVELVKMKNCDPEDRDILNTIEGCAERGASMVKQILSFSRGVEGERKEVQLKHLILDQEKIARDTFPKSIVFKKALAEKLWPIKADPTQVYQVLMNLCVNARDAMPDGGTLSVEASNLMLDEHGASAHVEAVPGPYVVLTVSDTGTGIPQEIMDKIFDPFFTTKDLTKGTGLGLSTTIGIVKSHGGFLSVYSEVGKGTSFRIYFPASSSETAERENNADNVRYRGNGEMILVVEDEPTIRKMTSEVLISHGFKCVTAENGEDALATFGGHREEIELAIIDMAMPIMDGPATIRALKRLNSKIKIIAVSGMAANLKGFEQTDIISSLQKPYSTRKLLESVTTILKDAVN